MNAFPCATADGYGGRGAAAKSAILCTKLCSYAYSYSYETGK